MSKTHCDDRPTKPLGNPSSIDARAKWEGAMVTVEVVVTGVDPTDVGHALQACLDGLGIGVHDARCLVPEKAKGQE